MTNYTIVESRSTAMPIAHPKRKRENKTDRSTGPCSNCGRLDGRPLPSEVEEVIHTHPKVGTVGVVGVPDARTGGERLVAFVVPRTGKIVDAAEISAYCASRLVNYKCPTEVRVVGQLPITAAQKLDRVALRRAVRGEQELATG